MGSHIGSVCSHAVGDPLEHHDISRQPIVIDDVFYIKGHRSSGGFAEHLRRLGMVQVLRAWDMRGRRRHKPPILDSRREDEMMSQLYESETTERSGEGIDSIEPLIRWIAPHTVGRARVLQRWADVKQARRDAHRLHEALCLLSHELDALYPKGPLVGLVRRRVRAALLTWAHP
jgi:hypothetical protein